MVAFPEGSTFGYLDQSVEGVYRLYCDPSFVDFAKFEKEHEETLGFDVECVDLRNAGAFESVPQGVSTIIGLATPKKVGHHCFSYERI